MAVSSRENSVERYSFNLVCASYLFPSLNVDHINLNGGVPIAEKFFSEKLLGKNNEDMALVLFPKGIEGGMEFLVDKEAMSRR
ncbi:hypothetical protein NC653_008680 [Populus alba x Populus x berolinensis]|uniref:Uncharacterized protein n=1 Tax=Populus alba x Populus x berolinensis TaxID=444605 RepID=A0AAD6R7E8_9ROSI|nr:hypothetical protein NC653_008680 [Populus alba x Populus x berolinensis]